MKRKAATAALTGAVTTLLIGAALVGPNPAFALSQGFLNGGSGALDNCQGAYRVEKSAAVTSKRSYLQMSAQCGVRYVPRGTGNPVYRALLTPVAGGAPLAGTPKTMSFDGQLYKSDGWRWFGTDWYPSANAKYDLCGIIVTGTTGQLIGGGCRRVVLQASYVWLQGGLVYDWRWG